jgi:1-acyl-sn-glycerol-3-phosphate acyltransferase
VHGCKVEFYGDSKSTPGESAVVMTNHQFHCDWMFAASSFASRYGGGIIVYILFAASFLLGAAGYIRIMLKKVILYIPFVGSSLLGLGSIFLSRDFAADQPRLLKTFDSVRLCPNMI